MRPMRRANVRFLAVLVALAVAAMALMSLVMVDPNRARKSVVVLMRKHHATARDTVDSAVVGVALLRRPLSPPSAPPAANSERVVVSSPEPTPSTVTLGEYGDDSYGDEGAEYIDETMDILDEELREEAGSAGDSQSRATESESSYDEDEDAFVPTDPVSATTTSDSPIDRTSEADAPTNVTDNAAFDPVDAVQHVAYPGNYDGSNIHIVFSSGCGQKNRLLFATMLQHSATRVGQRGPITQIISGCSEHEKAQVLAEPRFYYDYRVHFTPDYFPHPLPDIDDWYTAYNKPFALRHYLQHADPPVQHELVALTDGDIMFFKPLEANTGRNMTKYYQGTRDAASVTDEVKDGVALAQDWTRIIGSGFFGDKFGANKTEKMCADQPCASVSEDDALEYYAGTGPPYIMTLSDMLRLIDDYCHFVVEGRKVSDEWMTEMFGYGVAAANQGIKHTILTHLAPTHPFLNGHEYWSFLKDESLKANPCEDPTEVALPADPPAGLHYFHYYMLEGQGRQFHKGAIPKEILDCDSMLLEVPPASEYDAAFTRFEDNPPYMAQKRVEVWTECTLIKATNEAIVSLKSAMCERGVFNTTQGIVMMDDRNR